MITKEENLNFVKTLKGKMLLQVTETDAFAMYYPQEEIYNYNNYDIISSDQKTDFMHQCHGAVDGEGYEPRINNDPSIIGQCRYHIKKETIYHTDCLWDHQTPMLGQPLPESKVPAALQRQCETNLNSYQSENGEIFVELNGITYDIDTCDNMEEHIPDPPYTQTYHTQSGVTCAGISTLPKTIDNDVSIYKHGGKSKNCDKSKKQRKNKLNKDNLNRPRQKRLPRGCRLWEFLRGLLLSHDYNPTHIKWINRPVGEFKLVKSSEIARMWGEQKNNPGMTYEKLSRAMRYYYKREILAPVLGKRLIYRFGKKSYGWQ